MGNNLRALRIARKWTHDKAASAMGLSRGQFIKLERGERKLTERTIAQAAKGFAVSPLEVIQSTSSVPVVGYAGAGGEAFFEGSPGDETIEADAPEGTVAVRIRGTSLGPGFNGWYALYTDRRTPFTEDLFTRLCIVGTEDGRTLVKWVHRGPGPGVNLHSGVGEVEENVILAWAARVIDLKPE